MVFTSVSVPCRNKRDNNPCLDGKTYLLVATGISILQSMDIETNSGLDGSEWETLVEDDCGGIVSLDYHHKYVITTS